MSLSVDRKTGVATMTCSICGKSEQARARHDNASKRFGALGWSKRGGKWVCSDCAPSTHRHVATINDDGTVTRK